MTQRQAHKYKIDNEVVYRSRLRLFFELRRSGQHDGAGVFLCEFHIDFHFYRDCHFAFELLGIQIQPAEEIQEADPDREGNEPGNYKNVH